MVLIWAIKCGLYDLVLIGCNVFESNEFVFMKTHSLYVLFVACVECTLLRAHSNCPSRHICLLLLYSSNRNLPISASIFVFYFDYDKIWLLTFCSNIEMIYNFSRHSNFASLKIRWSNHLCAAESIKPVQRLRARERKNCRRPSDTEKAATNAH